VFERSEGRTGKRKMWNSGHGIFKAKFEEVKKK
jgi:hypothetical protein